MDAPDVSRVGLSAASHDRFTTERRQADDTFSFVPRADIAAAVRAEIDQTHRGADAPPCEGPS